MTKFPEEQGIEERNREKRIENVVREMNMARDSAERVEKIAYGAAEAATEAFMKHIENNSPNEAIRTAAVIVAHRMLLSTMKVSLQANCDVRETIVALKDASGKSFDEISKALNDPDIMTKGAPMPGDTCDCGECSARRAILGADPNADKKKEMMRGATNGLDALLDEIFKTARR